MQHIRFTSDGQTIKGFVYKPHKLTEKNPAMLFIHGWNTRQQTEAHYAQTMAKKGFITMTFDMRGHGESEGKQTLMTRTNFLEDTKRAYDILKQMPDVDTDRIFVAGSSMGGYMAALLSSIRPVYALALRVPANYPDNGFDTQTLTEYTTSPERITWRNRALAYNESVVLRAIHTFKGRILIVESEFDKLVPHQTIENYMNAVQDKNLLTYTVMKDAEHSISRDINKIDEYTDILSKWLMLS